MTRRAGELMAGLVGAEVLFDLATRHATGVLRWEGGVLELEQGRPIYEQGDAARAQLSSLVRAFACELLGAFDFSPVATSRDKAAGSLDPLGEALVAVLGTMPEQKLTSIFAARGAVRVAPSATFATLQAAAVRLGAVKIEVAAEGEELAALARGASLMTQRTLAASLFLGGLVVKVSPASAALRAKIEAMHARCEAEDHYAILGVARGSSPEIVHQRYLELCKIWHADNFAKDELGPVGPLVTDIFRRLEEAHRTLASDEERKAYDFLLARAAEGLPTDPRVILEAEATFKKAEALLRRGQPQGALELLTRALELNKGEAEFWIYLGYALYAARGAAAYAEARAHIERGLALQKESDVAYEFLGRMARSEGELEQARAHLQRALSLNQDNFEAARELRLLNLRESKPRRGLIGRLLGRR